MSRRVRLEDGENLVISVTPVSRGLVVPAVVLVIVETLVGWLATKWSGLHHDEPVALLIVGVLPVLVLLTRTWRWRSHKIIVTTQRMVLEGGVLGRHSTEVNLIDVIATHADQSFAERLRRRGTVELETPLGTVMVGPVRHPAALRRLVDRSRRDAAAAAAQSWDQWFVEPDEGDDRGGSRW